MKKKQSYYIGFAALCLSVMLVIGYQLNAMNYFGSLFRNLTTAAVSKPETPEITNSDNSIQIALLLDTSNSMDGLIEQAKSQLWKIVSELSNADKDGKTPNLQIALYEYGNDNLSARTGHIRQVTPFTSNMDLVSEKLFSLTTNGGSEYCGQVIKTSIDQLTWSNSDDGLRLIYIAGNEGFNQGPISYAQVCKAANNRGIVINTIFCGNQGTGMNLGWKNPAEITDGMFVSIDHNQTTTYTSTPYDRQIDQLNQQLNTTYIPYGDQGEFHFQNLTIQDNNAGAYDIANVADRAKFKSSKMYKNDNWDYVDAYEKDKSIIKDQSKIPTKFKGKDAASIEKEVQKEKDRRDKIKSEIQALSKKRKAHIKENVTVSDTVNLENSILKSVEKQAKKKGYKIKE